MYVTNRSVRNHVFTLCSGLQYGINIKGYPRIIAIIPDPDHTADSRFVAHMANDGGFDASSMIVAKGKRLPTRDELNDIVEMYVMNHTMTIYIYILTKVYVQVLQTLF